MPTFCRHNRLIQNCPICAREQAIELRPVVSSSAPRSTQTREAGPRRPSSGGSRTRSASAGVTVRRLARGADDGYHSRLVPGLRSSDDARRLAEELAFSEERLRILESEPPGPYAEVADPAGDVEERAWLCFLIAYLCPLEAGDPFEGIAAARTSWASGTLPLLDGVPLGPRTAHDPARGTQTLEAYRAWAARAGSQKAAFSGEAGWTPERRFERVFERLALPGLHRDARFDLLVGLGRLGVFELQAGSLRFGGPDKATLAAKRVFGIGDTMLLERRAAELAHACGQPLDVLDLALHNFESGQPVRLGVGPEGKADEAVVARIGSALGL